MNRVFLLALLSISSLIAIFSVSAIITNPIFAQKSMQTYENEKYGFKIQYPFNWELDDSGYLFENFELLGFLRSPSYHLTIAIEVYFDPSYSKLTFDQFVEKKLTEINNENSGSIGFNKLYNTDKSSKLGGYPAYKIVYEKWSESLLGKMSYPKYSEVGTIVDGVVYNLRLIFHNFEDLNKSSDTIQKIINSFEFIQ